MRTTLLVMLVLGAPQGWSTLRRGDETIDLYRDRWGVPHIFAPSVAAAFYAEGYAEAQDRLWQMERFRRSARGQSAELFGADHVGEDLDLRRSGYTDEELHRMFASCSERLRTILTAYGAGVNAFIREGRLPAEYARHRHEPRPWEEIDSIAIGIMMARRFGDSGAVELLIQTILQDLEKRLGVDQTRLILRDILRESDPEAPTTLRDEESPGGSPKDERHNWLKVDRDWLATVLRERAEAEAGRDALGIPTYGGSNAWVLGSRKSASGAPILYGGPMMGFKSPSICNEIHLVAPGLDVAGMSFPGVPGVMIGFNRKIAWTTTSGGADLADIYQLELSPENPEEYRGRDGWRKFDVLETSIPVANGEPRREKILRSRYGPLVGKPDTKRNAAYTVAMSFWLKEHQSFEAVLDLNFASSLEEAGRAVTKIVTSHNFFVADREGHIGFWYCGAHPIRRPGHDPRLIQKGDGSMDWEGILPFERWPQGVDPPRGYYANWNNKPSRSWEPSPFGRIFWGKRILDVLDQDRKFTLDETLAIARETAYHDFLADYFMPHLLEAARGESDPNVARAAELFAKYDRRKRDGEAAPAIVERWFTRMIQKVFGDEFGLLALQKDAQRLLMDPLLYLMEGRGRIRFDFANGRDLKELAREALKETVKDGIESLAWKEPTIDFKGKIGKVRSARGRGTYQIAVELAPDGPKALAVAPPGVSENPESTHFADQLPLFADWKYRPVAYRREEMK